MKLTNKEPLIKNIVFISGLTRSGKSLLCPIISSFNNTEKVNVNFALEQIPMLNYLKEISDNSSKFLLQSGINSAIYDNSIGRNVNFRPDDFTSIWKYRDPMEYIKRLFQSEGDSALNRLNSNNRLFPMMIHNGLWHANIWFKAFPSVKFIHMQRNPVDIIYAWSRKGYGEDFYSSSRANTVTYQYKKKLLPYYAFGWEDEYLSYKKVDRIIHMVKHIRNHHQDSYDNLNDHQKKSVLFVRHQELITETDKNLRTISDFIGEEPSADTPSVLLNENCPRSPNVKTPFSTSEKKLNEKLKEIKKLSTSNSYDSLLEMKKEFELTKLAI